MSEPFASNAVNIARRTRVSYAYADVALSVAWIAAVAASAPTWLVFLPGLVAGVAAVLVDAVWLLRSGKRLILVNGAPPSRRFVLWWLAVWFDFLIAFNIGTLVGLGLALGPTSPAFAPYAAAFLLWYCVLTPVLSRLLSDRGIGADVVETTRIYSARAVWIRAVAPLVLYAAMAALPPRQGPGYVAELFLLGVLAAGSMEIPLYALGIRPGNDAWKTMLVNTLFEWNMVPPIFHAIFVAAGVAS